MILYLAVRRYCREPLCGSLLVFLAYVRSIGAAVMALLQTYIDLKEAEASIDRVVEIFESDDAVRDAPDARPLPARPAGQRGHVRLEGITFGYEPGQAVLENISMEVSRARRWPLWGGLAQAEHTCIAYSPFL
jgi:ABC-type multidrug transport system fused ATPase/permease subunit